MTRLRIPPRQDFDVNEQVYEWFRTLSTEIQKLKTSDSEEGIDLLLGFFSSIEKQITDLESIIEDRAIETHEISKLEKALNNNESISDDGFIDKTLLLKIEKRIDELALDASNSFNQSFKISEVIKTINDIKSFIDTGELLSGRIDLLSRAISNIDIDGILVSLALITKEKPVNIYGSMLISEQEKDIAIPALNHENMVCDIFIEESTGYNFKSYMGCGLASNTLVKVFKAESIGSVNFKIRIKER